MMLRLPSIIGNNMVLQAGARNPIWGWAEPGARVSVGIGGTSVGAAAGKDGKWRVRLPVLPEGGPYRMTVSRGRQAIVVRNILVGEVWLCSGQSNMLMSLGETYNAKKVASSARERNLRFFTVEHVIAAKPQDDVVGKWVECTPKTASAFSAVGYFFGRDLLELRNAPVGMIMSAVGGTNVQAWTSRKMLLSNPVFRKDLAWEERALAQHGPLPALYSRSDMPEDAGQGLRCGYSTSLYNGMIKGLAPYGLRGVLWYQGENNAWVFRGPFAYRASFRALICDWRRLWRHPRLPFLFVQLPNIRPGPNEPSDTDPASGKRVGGNRYALVREAQLMALVEPDTAMVVTVDTVNEHDDRIHPRKKQPVADRLLLAAREVVYGENIKGLSPVYESMSVEGGRIRLKFRNTGGGLEARGGRLDGFLIAGRDRRFMPAHARTEKDAVIVWHRSVTRPVAVRYALADNPVVSLYNSEGLPASPFRTDGWHIEKTRPGAGA